MSLDKYRDTLHPKSKPQDLKKWAEYSDAMKAYFEYYPSSKTQIMIRDNKTGKLIADLVKV